MAALVAAEQLLRETQSEPMPAEAEVDHQLLALAVRLSAGRDVRIVDFGGGVGQSYAALRRMIAAEVGLRYRVAELDSVVERGREIWKGNGEIEFVSDGDLSRFKPSIIFAKGVIQYFADYPAILRRWFSSDPAFVLLEKLPVVSSPSYVTNQLDVYGESLPYWMFNLDDVVRPAREHGYRVALRRRLERAYDQSDFPSELRMDRATSLLFERAP